jgi:ATP-dependent Lon protease
VWVAFDYFKANSSRVSASIKPSEHDFHLQLVELQNAGAPQSFTLASFIALCSAALGRPVQSQMAIMGDMSLGGTVVQVRTLAESLQVAFDASAKKISLPMSSVGDIPSVPGELFAKFQTSFYSDPSGCSFQGDWSRVTRTSTAKTSAILRSADVQQRRKLVSPLSVDDR